MTEQIWKFPLAPGLQIMRMPAESHPIYVAVQRDLPYLWARVYPAKPTVMRRFDVVGTGHDFEGGEHVGSFMLGDGALVFHVLDHGEEG